MYTGLRGFNYNPLQAKFTPSHKQALGLVSRPRRRPDITCKTPQEYRKQALGLVSRPRRRPNITCKTPQEYRTQPSDWHEPEASCCTGKVNTQPGNRRADGKKVAVQKIDSVKSSNRGGKTSMQSKAKKGKVNTQTTGGCSSRIDIIGSTSQGGKLAKDLNATNKQPGSRYGSTKGSNKQKDIWAGKFKESHTVPTNNKKQSPVQD